MSLREIFGGKHYLVYLDDAMRAVVDYIMATREDADQAYKTQIRLDTLKLMSKTEPAFSWPTDVPGTDRDGYGEGCRIEMIVEEEK